MPTLDLTPTTIDLKLRVSDDVDFYLIVYANHTRTIPFDFTGFTSWAGTITPPTGSPVSFAIDDTDQATGRIHLTLDSSLLSALPEKGCRWTVTTVNTLTEDKTVILGRVTIQSTAISFSPTISSDLILTTIQNPLTVELVALGPPGIQGPAGTDGNVIPSGGVDGQIIIVNNSAPTGVDFGETAVLAIGAQSPEQEPVAVGITADVGSLDIAARADHVHPQGDIISLVPPVRSGSWYRRPIYVNGAAGINALNASYGTKVLLGAGTLDRMGLYHVASATASEVMRLGLYTELNGRPDALIADYGTISLASATAFKTITISQVILAGFYWLVAARQGPTAVATVLNYGSSNHIGDNAILTEMNDGLSEPGHPVPSAHGTAVGALPDPFTFGSMENDDGTAPILFIRYA